jgi:hypothetical protein
LSIGECSTKQRSQTSGTKQNITSTAQQLHQDTADMER